MVMRAREIAIGVRATGDRLVLPLPFPHSLIAGTTGGGKSGLINAFCGALAEFDDVALFGTDLKRVELWPWRERMTRVAVTPVEADALLGDFGQLLDVRSKLLQDLGLRVWTPELGVTVVAIFDELAELGALSAISLADAVVSGNEQAKKRVLSAMKTSLTVRVALLGSLSRIARACGVIIIGCTQYPSSDVIDQQIRSQMELRFMMRVSSGEQVSVCLGQGASQNITPKSIGSDERGAFILAGLPGEPHPFKARAYWVSDEAVAARVAQTRHLRVPESRVFPWLGVSDAA